MPILDCELYSLEAMSGGPMQHLKEEILQKGGNPQNTPISYINIYFGMQHLRTPLGGPWYVCVPRPYGFLTVLFHRVKHGDVVMTTLPELADTRGLAITLIWTSGSDLGGELLDALRTADEMVKHTEMTLGIALPLPLSRQQLPDRFAVKTIIPFGEDGAEQSRIYSLIPDDTYGVVIDEKTAISVGFLAGALGSIDNIMDSPMKRALHLSSKWQRQAIRSIGMEDWANVVIASNTWIETFLVQLAVLLNEAINTPISDVPKAVMKSGLASFINTHLGQRFLKGRWDHTDEGTEFGRWYKMCFSLRNAIVHAGHFSNEKEAAQAYAAAHSLAYFVTDCAAKITDKRLTVLLEPLKSMSAARKI